MRYLFWFNDVTFVVVCSFVCIVCMHIIFYSVEWDVAFILSHVFINSNIIYIYFFGVCVCLPKIAGAFFLVEIEEENTHIEQETESKRLNMRIQS